MNWSLQTLAFQILQHILGNCAERPGGALSWTGTCSRSLWPIDFANATLDNVGLPSRMKSLVNCEVARISVHLPPK